MLGLIAESASGSSSPKRKNPKNAEAAMAHNTTLFGSDEEDRVLWILAKTWTVIGSRMRGCAPFCARVWLIPVVTIDHVDPEDLSAAQSRQVRLPCLWSKAPGQPEMQQNYIVSVQ